MALYACLAERYNKKSELKTFNKNIGGYQNIPLQIWFQELKRRGLWICFSRSLGIALSGLIKFKLSCICNNWGW